MVRPDDLVRRGLRFVAEGHQRRLVLHQKGDETAHEARVTHGLAQRSGIGAGQCQETGQEFRVPRAPALAHGARRR